MCLSRRRTFRIRSSLAKHAGDDPFARPAIWRLTAVSMLPAGCIGPSRQNLALRMTTFIYAPVSVLLEAPLFMLRIFTLGSSMTIYA
jgi:hypothetical protein